MDRTARQPHWVPFDDTSSHRHGPYPQTIPPRAVPLTHRAADGLHPRQGASLTGRTVSVRCNPGTSNGVFVGRRVEFSARCPWERPLPAGGTPALRQDAPIPGSQPVSGSGYAGLGMRRTGSRVDDWRGGVRSVGVAVSRRLSQYRCLAPRHRSVSSRRSSNRMRVSRIRLSDESMPSPTESSSFAPQGESGPFHSTGACPGTHISPLVPCACDTTAGSHNPAAEAPVPQATATRLARTDSRELPSLSHGAPPGVSEPVPGRSGSRQSPSPFLLLVPLSNPGPFPPPALPGFPGTPGLSATPYGPACPSRGSGWHVPRHRRGFPCCVHPPLLRAAAIPPAEPAGARVARFPPDTSLPRVPSGSASALPVSKPARRSLALRPAGSPSRLRDPSHRSASVHVVASIDRSDCDRLERRLPGGIRTR